MMKLILMAFFWLSLSASAHAEKCERRFRVSVNAYQPFYFVNQYGEVSGLTYDIVKELESRLGCTLLMQPSEIPRMLEDFKNWRTDIIAFIANNETVSKTGNFIELYTVHRKLVVVKSSFVKDKKISEYVSDPKIKFTHQIGAHPYITDAELELLKKQDRIVQVPSPEVAYQMLITDRVQAFFSSPVVHSYYLKEKKEAKDKITTVLDPNLEIPVGLFISKKRINAKEAARIKDAVVGMRTDGSLRKIVLKYIQEEDLKDYNFTRGLVKD